MPRRMTILVLALDAVCAMALALSGVPAVASIVAGGSAGLERVVTVVLPFLFAASVALWCPAAAALAFAGSGPAVGRVATITLTVVARGAVVAAALGFLLLDLPWVGAAALLAFTANASTVRAIRRSGTTPGRGTPQRCPRPLVSVRVRPSCSAPSPGRWPDLTLVGKRRFGLDPAGSLGWVRAYG